METILVLAFYVIIAYLVIYIQKVRHKRELDWMKQRAMEDFKRKYKHWLE